MTRLTNFRIADEDKAELDHLAKSMGISSSTLIRLAIKQVVCNPSLILKPNN
jgi:antitoxin component of RelBE/YafQ-DinJ toxin-antitoxin module